MDLNSELTRRLSNSPLAVAVAQYRTTGDASPLWDVCERYGAFVEDLGTCPNGVVYSISDYVGPLTLTPVLNNNN